MLEYAPVHVPRIVRRDIFKSMLVLLQVFRAISQKNKKQKNPKNKTKTKQTNKQTHLVNVRNIAKSC